MRRRSLSGLMPCVERKPAAQRQVARLLMKISHNAIEAQPPGRRSPFLLRFTSAPMASRTACGGNRHPAPRPETLVTRVARETTDDQ